MMRIWLSNQLRRYDLHHRPKQRKAVMLLPAPTYSDTSYEEDDRQTHGNLDGTSSVIN